MNIEQRFERRQLVLIIPVFFAALFSFRPADASEAWHVAGLPSVRTQQVVFENAGARLQGTLYAPATDRPVPAIVAFHDASVGTAGAGLYRHLREGLPAIDIAVLLFDKRGSGGFTGSANEVSYETLADDGIAGARAIAKLPQIDPSRIGSDIGD